MSEHQLVPSAQHRAKLTMRDFLLLDEHGAFTAYRKTELIDGDIYVVNAQHRPHGMVKTKLYDSLRDSLRAMGSSYRPVQEFSLALSETSAPEPDIMLTDEPEGPGLVPVRSVALVIEVSDTTLAMDLQQKSSVYASAAVPEYWIADVNARVLHQRWSPCDGRYDKQRQIAFGDAIVCAVLPGLRIETNDL